MKQEIQRVDRLSEIMHLQLVLQQRLYPVWEGMTTRERVDYIRTMVLSCEDELHEALNESNWKPWAAGAAAIHRESFIGELVDALHFLMNLFLVVETTPDELFQMYTDKNFRNHARQDSGYDGTAKCGRCGRECATCG